MKYPFFIRYAARHGHLSKFKSYPIKGMTGCFMNWWHRAHWINGGFILCDAQYARDFELPQGIEGYGRELQFNLG
jgi:hypothetical protein